MTEPDRDTGGQNPLPDEDCSQWKRLSEHREIEREILRICHCSENQTQLMRDLVAYFQKVTKCEAVGVRLRQGNDFPYYETTGFPDSFVERENFLCDPCPENEMGCKDMENPVLACMCGNVISARFDPSKPFFTKNGSFWTNSASDFLTATSESERGARSRNRCNREGYESVALVPLRSKGQTFGLFQFNDRRRDIFNSEQMEFIEHLVDYVALALSKEEAKRLLGESEARLRMIAENTADMVSQHDLDGRIQYLSPSSERLLGYKMEELVGKKPDVVVPPEDLKALQSAIDEAMRKGTDRYRLQHQMVRKDGSRIWVETSGSLIYNQSHHPFQILCIVRDITQQKHSSAALQESRNRFIALYQGSPAPTFTWQKRDDDFVLIDFNNAARTITAGKVQNFLGKKAGDLYAERSEVLQDLRRCHDQENTLIREMKSEHFVPGRIVSVTYTFVPQDLVLVHLEDVTEQKKAEEELRASEERYRRTNQIMAGILEHTHMMAVLLDTRFNFIWVNRAYAETCRQDPSFFQGKNHFDLYPHEENEAIFQRVVDTGEPLFVTAKSFQFSDQPERGVTYWDWSLIPIKNPEGRVSNLVFTLAEVTDRIKAEESARESEEKLRLFIEYAPAALAMFDKDMRYLAVSRRWISDYKLGSVDIIGKSHYEVFPDVPDRWKTAHRQGLNGEIVHKSVDFFERLNGAVQWLEWEIRPWYKAGGTVGGIVIFTEDITERKRAEEMLHRSRDELEMRVHERTAELERKNRELQEFAFVASHDLTEPLRKIQAFGSLLQTKAGDHLIDQEKGYISRMVDAANRMQMLLDALLRYSRIETKGEEFKSTDLNEVVQDVISDLEVEIENARARFEIVPLPVVLGDPSQLRQCFQNLIANALKYRRPDVELKIRIRGEEAEGKCHVYVADNGIGFDEIYLGKIFQPFQRLHGRKEYPGTGIGLAICRKVVERHGGTITAKSTPGKGSTFIVTLPVNGEIR